MSSFDFLCPTRYDFKIEDEQEQRLIAEFGQYVTYDQYHKLLKAFCDLEDDYELVLSGCDG